MYTVFKINTQDAQSHKESKQFKQSQTQTLFNSHYHLLRNNAMFITHTHGPQKKVAHTRLPSKGFRS